MSWIRYSLTKSRHTGENVVGRFRPDEGRRRGVREREIVAGRRLEGAGAAVRPTLDLFVGQQGKPALDEIEPGGAGRRKVQVKPDVAGEPAADARRLVRPVVVEDEMHVEIRRHGRLNRVEEPFKLLTAMAPMTLPDDLASGDIQRGKERGRAVPPVVAASPYAGDASR